MQLSTNFTLAEMCVSREAALNGLRNKPNKVQTENLRLLCHYILQPLRNRVARPVVVTSGFRTPTLNKLVGGTRGSQHTKGQAADIIVPGIKARDLAELIYVTQLPFDQLINEFGEWVHISFNPDAPPRKEYLTCRMQNGKRIYTLTPR